MLTNVFEWLDLHGWSYWAGTGGATLLWLAWVGRAIRRDPEAARSTWGDAGMLALLLLAWRWPFLFAANAYNPDESQFLAGAITLTHDPVFWRSVDGVTSGPLNLYVLLPLHFLGLPLDYFTARLVGLICVWGALVSCHRLITRISGRAVAWLSLVPAVLFFATMTSADFVHYSSELLVIFLLALAVQLFLAPPPRDRRARWWAAFIAGALPWAKMQAAPLTVVLVMWGAWLAWRDAGRGPRVKRLAGVAFAALLPTFITLALTSATGQTSAAINRYILGSLHYAGLNSTVAESLHELVNRAVVDGRLPILLGSTLLLVLIAGAWVLLRRARHVTPATIGAALVVAAVVAIITPRRGFLHYTVLLPVPLTLLVGGLLGGAWRSCASRRGRIALSALVLAIAALPPLVTRWRQGLPEIYGHFTDDWNHPRGKVAVLIDALAHHEGWLAVWGWADEYFVEAGLPQATRDPHIFWLLEPGPDREYHRADYLADFERHRPVVFADATGPLSFGYVSREQAGHETFPALAAIIRRDYTLVRDVGEARVYARNDLPALRELTPERIDRLLARGRLTPGGNGIAPTRQSGPLPRHNVGGGSMPTIEPPNWVEWDLPDDVREITLQFGIDPVAYTQGTTNGADLFLKLRCNGRTRTIWHRFLDPRNDPAARGTQSATLALPPFQPGTQLVLRTGPGPRGDAAWDWVYLASMEFKRRLALLPAQLPGFVPRPTEVDAEDATLGKTEGRAALLVHNDASFTYVLKGGERGFRFTGGIVTNSSAPESGVRAIFRVELHHPAAPFTLLAEHTVSGAGPSSENFDQSLPEIHAGDRIHLTVHLESANSNAAASVSDAALR